MAKITIPATRPTASTDSSAAGITCLRAQEVTEETAGGYPGDRPGRPGRWLPARRRRSVSGPVPWLSLHAPFPQLTVSVNVCVAVPTEFVAVIVRVYVPAVVGVPARVAVPLPLLVYVSPATDPVCVTFGTG